jgi:predicted GNAT family acetyltransferase
MNAELETQLADNREDARYEIRVGGELAGLLQYRLRGETISLLHTEVEGRFEGRGLGSKLIVFALDDARARGLAVLPFCPFVKGYLERHSEYLGLVPESRRGQFGL